MRKCWEFFSCTTRENCAVFTERIVNCWEFMDAACKRRPTLLSDDDRVTYCDNCAYRLYVTKQAAAGCARQS